MLKCDWRRRDRFSFSFSGHQKTVRACFFCGPQEFPAIASFLCVCVGSRHREKKKETPRRILFFFCPFVASGIFFSLFPERITSFLFFSTSGGAAAATGRPLCSAADTRSTVDRFGDSLQPAARRPTKRRMAKRVPQARASASLVAAAERSTQVAAAADKITSRQSSGMTSTSMSSRCRAHTCALDASREGTPCRPRARSRTERSRQPPVLVST